MKYKKTILLFLLLTTIFTPNIVKAVQQSNYDDLIANCYYVNNENGQINFAGYATFYYHENIDYSTIGKSGGITEDDVEKSFALAVSQYFQPGSFRAMVINGKGNYTELSIKNITQPWDYWGSGRGDENSLPARPVDVKAIKRDYNNCPKYVFGSYGWGLWGQSDNVVGIVDDREMAYYHYSKLDNADFIGSLISEDEFWGGLGLCENGVCELGEDVTLSCDNHKLFGDPKQAGEKEIDLNGNGKIDPPSLAYTINEALKYMRIIVPLLIIALGTIDIAKAVIASKEDEMSQAQKKFVKRIIAGVAVFLVPVFVNMIMSLADIVWESSDPNETYTSCTLEQIQK